MFCISPALCFPSIITKFAVSLHKYYVKHVEDIIKEGTKLFNS